MRRICIDLDNVITETDPVLRKVILQCTGVSFHDLDIKTFNYFECHNQGGQTSPRNSRYS